MTPDEAAGMNCPSCGFDNPEGHRFCGGCGQALILACPSCGTENAPGFRFCGQCGTALTEESPGRTPAAGREPRSYTPKHLAEKILRSKSALEGERKQVTVLFADVKGSMQLAEQVDPEEWHSILDRFFQILTDGVHRFEGTVNQYTGDGIMALFGAPIAREDHAQRACYAALYLRDELRGYADGLRLSKDLNFSVRIGLNSGEVVVGKIGDDLRMDYTAQGYTVGLAERMEQLAESGRAYISEPTARLVEGFFELRSLGESHVRGISKPVGVYELEGAGPMRTRLDVARWRGLSRFVGRADEMTTLELALNHAREGSGQVVGVVGEAGVGKSRLCLEFIERCRAQGLTVTAAHCPAHGKTVPFLPVLELLRGFFGITDRDPEQAAREKIAGRMLLLDESLNDVLPLVFDFLGVPDPARPVPRMDPEVRQRQLYAFVRRLVQARSAREPALILVDDVHWIDPGSDAFLAQFIDVVEGTRTMLLVNFRPEYHADWTQRSYYQQLPLGPLGRAAIRELLDGLLGHDPSMAGLAEAIHERAAGNPFFTEEIVQSLIESGHLEGTSGSYRLVTPIERLEVPDSVHALLAARIDRLAERDKRVLQTAAVIGKEFTEGILAAVVELPRSELGEALGALRASEFVYERSLYPEAEFVFKHPLTQQVAQESQLQERLQRTHARVAAALETAHAGKLDEHAALIAHHWQKARRSIEAARWHRRAAEWVGASDAAQAIRHWREVRTLALGLPESTESTDLRLAACTAILDLGWRLGLSDAEAATIFAEGRGLASRSSDPGALALFLDGYASVLRLGGDLEASRQIEREALEAAEKAGDAEVTLAVRLYVPYAHFLVGRLGDALTITDQLLADARGADLAVVARHKKLDPYLFLLLMRGMLLSERGRLDEGRRELDRVIELARERGEMETLGWALSWRARCAWLVGDAQAALHHARASAEAAERSGGAFSRVSAYIFLGRAQIVNEEWSKALAVLEQALKMARESRTGLEQEGAILSDLAEARLGCGDPSDARAVAEQAITVTHTRGTRVYECEAHRVLARTLLRSEGRSSEGRIREALERALELARETGARSYEPFIHVELAELARLVGDAATRERELRRAHRLFVDMGGVGHAERLARELEGLSGETS